MTRAPCGRDGCACGMTMTERWALGHAKETPAGVEIRAGGDCACATCGRAYWQHPHTGDRTADGDPWLHRICDGRIVKL